MKDKTFYTIVNTCAAIVIIMIIIVIASCIHQISSVNNTHYIIEAKIIDIDATTNTIQVEDTYGEVWEFFGIDNFQENDSVIILMNNQKTSTPYDDEILDVHLDPFNL